MTACITTFRQTLRMAALLLPASFLGRAAVSGSRCELTRSTIKVEHDVKVIFDRGAYRATIVRVDSRSQILDCVWDQKTNCIFVLSTGGNGLEVRRYAVVGNKHSDLYHFQPGLLPDSRLFRNGSGISVLVGRLTPSRSRFLLKLVDNSSKSRLAELSEVTDYDQQLNGKLAEQRRAVLLALKPSIFPLASDAIDPGTGGHGSVDQYGLLHSFPVLTGSVSRPFVGFDTDGKSVAVAGEQLEVGIHENGGWRLVDVTKAARRALHLSDSDVMRGYSAQAAYGTFLFGVHVQIRRGNHFYTIWVSRNRGSLHIDRVLEGLLAPTIHFEGGRG